MLISRFVFFYSSISTPFPRPLLYSTCLTSLYNMFWAIQQELFFMLILKEFTKLQKRKTVMEFLFSKVIGSHHPSLLKLNPRMSVFLETTEILIWWTFQNSYYMESLRIIYKFFPLVTFWNMGFILGIYMLINELRGTS